MSNAESFYRVCLKYIRQYGGFCTTWNGRGYELDEYGITITDDGNALLSYDDDDEDEVFAINSGFGELLPDRRGFVRALAAAEARGKFKHPRVQAVA